MQRGCPATCLLPAAWVYAAAKTVTAPPVPARPGPPPPQAPAASPLRAGSSRLSAGGAPAAPALQDDPFADLMGRRGEHLLGRGAPFVSFLGFIPPHLGPVGPHIASTVLLACCWASHIGLALAALPSAQSRCHAAVATYSPAGKGGGRGWCSKKKDIVKLKGGTGRSKQQPTLLPVSAALLLWRRPPGALRHHCCHHSGCCPCGAG